MSARDSILGRLRGAPTATDVALPDVVGWYAKHTRVEDSQQRVARLCQVMQAVRTEIHPVTPSTWTDTLLQLIASKGLRHMLIGTDTVHGEALAARACAHLEIIRYERPIEAWRDQLFDACDAALTQARGAIAETGSLILWPTPAEPRLMSLVPATHFVLLDAASVHADFHSAMAHEGWSQGMPTNALLISGPSKTADIQQTLAYGAHGPRELVVLLLNTAGDST